MGMFNLGKQAFRYLLDRDSVSEVFTLNVVDEPENPIPFWGGLYTIRPPKLKNPRDVFDLTPKNFVPGYVHASGNTNTLDLTTGKPKLLVLLKASYYHFFIDDMGSIIEALEQYPDHELIIDLSDVAQLIDSDDPSSQYYFEFLLLLKHHNVEHKVTKISDFDVVYIDDFYIIDFIKYSSLKADKIYEYFLPYVKDKNIKPHRHIYVSRKLLDDSRIPLNKKENGELAKEDRDKATRIDDELALENLFKSLGFEIVYPELFLNMDDQINFFYSVKTIASLTSSGLTNSVFMQPGGTVIEIVSPIVAFPISPGGIREPMEKSVHNFYKDLSFLKNHVYLTIQNKNYRFDDVKATILNNPALEKFLTVKDEQINNL